MNLQAELEDAGREGADGRGHADPGADGRGHADPGTGGQGYLKPVHQIGGSCGVPVPPHLRGAGPLQSCPRGRGPLQSWEAGLLLATLPTHNYYEVEEELVTLTSTRPVTDCGAASPAHRCSNPLASVLDQVS